MNILEGKAYTGHHGHKSRCREFIVGHRYFGSPGYSRFASKIALSNSNSRRRAGRKKLPATVQKILDSGMQVEHFREVLDEESRRLGIKASRAKLNETDMLYPLTITHFLLVPMIFILPVVAIATLPIIILGIPVLYLLEVLLIRRKLLINAIKLLETWFGKQIIHVPDAGNDHCSNDAKVLDASNIAVHFHKVPRVVFLGLFSWLIIHWTLRLDSLMTEFILAGLFYVLLLGIVGIVATALESNLVLVDPARGRIIPIADWLDSMLTPIVGVGLLFLLGRDLMTEARDDGNTIYSQPQF